MSKTYKNLFEKMTSFENLLLAAKKAQRGKRMKRGTVQFNFFLEKELLKLQDELRSETYQPGSYRHFLIYEPKPRLISAAPYRDRVVHHAFCNIVEPLFDKTFIHDSYACRRGKGTHRALDRTQKFLRANKYVLQCDIRKYFPSIDHEILLKLIAGKIRDEKALWLARLIVSLRAERVSLRGRSETTDEAIQTVKIASQKALAMTQVGQRLAMTRSKVCHCEARSAEAIFLLASASKGLPIGNLTSQFFANVYLNELDYFLKFGLREKYYIRYMDDFLIFGNEKSHLNKIKEEVNLFLSNGLGLRLHPKKNTVFPVRPGVGFLGFRLFKGYRRLKRSNIMLFRARMKRYFCLLFRGLMTMDEIAHSLRCWLAHCVIPAKAGIQATGSLLSQG